MNEIKLSVICIAYNQAAFIRDCLNGFIAQKTDFRFEVLIHDDASTDGTAAIIESYAQQYPDLFSVIIQTSNQFSLGVDIEKKFLFPQVKGKYVAFCEGDDYWTDPDKLQKQVDFLDSHPDYSVCFHPVSVHWEDQRCKDILFPPSFLRFHQTELTLKELLVHNFIQTNSVVYRWRFHQDSLDLIPDHIQPSDWYFHLLHAETGKIKYLDEVMAVYRRNEQGIWTGAGCTKQWFQRFGIAYLNFLSRKAAYFHTNERTEFFLMWLQISCIHQDTALTEAVKQIFPSDIQAFNQYIKYNFWRLWWCRIKKITAASDKKRALKKQIALRKQLLHLNSNKNNWQQKAG